MKNFFKYTIVSFLLIILTLLVWYTDFAWQAGGFVAVDFNGYFLFFTVYFVLSLLIYTAIQKL